MPGTEVQFYVALFTAILKIAERDILTVVMKNIEVFWKKGLSPALKTVIVVCEEPDATIFSAPADFKYGSRLLQKFGYYFFFQSMRHHMA